MKYAVAASEVRGKHIIEIPDFKLKYEMTGILPVDVLRTEAHRRLNEALQGFIDARIDVPEPVLTPKELNAKHGSPSYKARWISVPVQRALKIDAYMVWRASGITETRLARMVGMSRMGVRNLFKLDVLSELRNIVAIIEACGYQLKYELVPAPEK